MFNLLHPLRSNLRKLCQTIQGLREVHVVSGIDKCSSPQSRGLVLGVYSHEENRNDPGLLTPNGWQYNQNCTKGRLLELLRLSGPMPRRGECRLFFNLEPNFSVVCVSGLGNKCLDYDSHETIDEGKEAVRIAAATGCWELMKTTYVNKIYVESFENTEASAEGAAMGIWVYQKMKDDEHKYYIPQIELHVECGMEYDYDGWKVGLEKAAAQNLARGLMETPSNYMTPTKFAQDVVNVLCDSGVNVEVKVRAWAESQQMHSFLTIAKGSSEPPIFLELSYYGSHHDEPPIVLVGQGNTFNSGGINLLASDKLENMRGDMCGAAIIVATCRAIATLRLPVNIRGLIPLCEHMIGCNAVKPGDVIKCMNGKSIQIESTKRCAPLIIVDALLYAQNFCPKFIIDITTITPQIQAAFGHAACGVYTNTDNLWQQIKNAAAHTGDRVWRMPLWNHYTKQVCEQKSVDVNNLGLGRKGASPKAAALLREFVPDVPWMHIDAYGVMFTRGTDFHYLRRGMTGRPTRTLIEFIAQNVCNDCK